MHGVLLFPGRRLHLLEAGAHDHLDVLAAEAARGAAAVHGGIAAAEHDHALADLVDVAERDGREPVDADVDVRGRFLAAGNFEVAAARRAGADEDRVPVLGQQRLEAVDARAAAELDAEIEDVVALPRRSSIPAGGICGICVRIMPPALRILVEHDAVIAERREIARDRQRSGAAADERDALAVLAAAAASAGGRGCRP